MRYRTWFGGPCVTFLPLTLPSFSTSGLRGQVWTVRICYNGLWTPLWRKVSWNMVGSIEAQWVLHFQLILTCRFDKTERLHGKQGLNQHWLLLKPKGLWNSYPVNIMSGLLRQRIWKINIYCWQQKSSLKTISWSQNKQRSQISNRKKKNEISSFALGLTIETLSTFGELDSDWTAFMIAHLWIRAKQRQTDTEAFPAPLFLLAGSPICS